MSVFVNSIPKLQSISAAATTILLFKSTANFAPVIDPSRVINKAAFEVVEPSPTKMSSAVAPFLTKASAIYFFPIFYQLFCTILIQAYVAAPVCITISM